MRNLLHQASILIFVFGCQADVKVKTRSVKVKCELNPLHPQCQDNLAATDTAEGEENLPPAFKNYKLAGPAEDGYINKNESTSTEKPYTVEPMEGIEATYTGWMIKTSECDKNQIYDQEAMANLTSVPEADGSYYICVQLRDPKRNRFSYGRTPLITVDATPPVIGKLAAMKLGKAADLKPEITETSAATYKWERTKGPGKATFSTESKANTTFAGTTPGDYQIKLTVTDIAKNIASTTVDILWDGRVPVFGSLKGVNDASDGIINGAEAGSKKPLFTLEGKDFETVAYTKPIKTNTKLKCDAKATYDQDDLPRATALTLDGSFAICAVLKNKAGVTSYGSSELIIRDTTPPTGELTELGIISDGYLNAAEHSTSQDLFTFTPVEKKATSTYAVINTAQFCKDTVFGEMPKSDNSTLDAENIYRICVKHTDAAGNSAYLESEEFTVDVTLPTLTSVTLGNEVADSSNNI